MDVLMVLWDGGGNVPPQLGIARRLLERGHSVRMLAHRSLRERIEAAGAEFVPYRSAPEGDASSPETDLMRDWAARTPIGAAAAIRDNVMYGPVAEFARDTAAEIDRRRPDAMTVDLIVQGGFVAAEARGVPAAALIHFVYPLPAPGVPPFGMGFLPRTGPMGLVRDALFTRLFEATYRPGLKPLNAARVEFGLAPLDRAIGVDHIPLALVLTAPEFDFAGRAPLPPNVRYAGPVLDQEPEGGWDSPWPTDHRDPLVVAGFSTTFQDQRGLAERVVAAMAGLPVRGLVTTGPAIDPAELPASPNVEVRRFVPHTAVMPKTRLVICHGGLGTVHTALAAGVPLICIPHGRDQADTAARVIVAGAGKRLSRHASTRRLRAAIADALAEQTLREGARRMQVALRRRDGATRVAEELEALASGQPAA